jgi:hypothetical protein
MLSHWETIKFADALSEFMNSSLTRASMLYNSIHSALNFMYCVCVL